MRLSGCWALAHSIPFEFRHLRTHPLSGSRPGHCHHSFGHVGSVSTPTARPVYPGTLCHSSCHPCLSSFRRRESYLVLPNDCPHWVDYCPAYFLVIQKRRFCPTESFTLGTSESKLRENNILLFPLGETSQKTPISVTLLSFL